MSWPPHWVGSYPSTSVKNSELLYLIPFFNLAHSEAAKPIMLLILLGPPTSDKGFLGAPLIDVTHCIHLNQWLYFLFSHPYQSLQWLRVFLAVTGRISMLCLRIRNHLSGGLPLSNGHMQMVLIWLWYYPNCDPQLSVQADASSRTRGTGQDWFALFLNLEKSKLVFKSAN